MKLKNTRQYYYILIAYGLLVVLATTGFKNVFGSEIDWVGQHSAFPEIFRQNFYQTGRLLPNFVFELGGGQNIFNFAYYGLLSPIFLISYLLPFVDMITFTAVMGILQYIMGGLLVFTFLRNHYPTTSSFFASIVFMSLAPIVVYSRYHIMFVWYIPFLILALIGLDRYFDKKKVGTFIVGVVCIIMTNYYFSVACLICLYIYALYRILNEPEFSWKTFIWEAFKTGLLFLVPVLLCAFFLLPTASALMEGSRPYKVAFETKRLFVPTVGNVFYGFFSHGITGTMLIALFGNLFSKNTKLCDKFLNITLIIFTLCPAVVYALNGGLYLNSKVIIPFLVLYIYCFVQFLINLEERNVKILPSVLIPLALMCVCYFVYRGPKLIFKSLSVELLFFALCYIKPKFTKLIYSVTVLCCLIGCFANTIPYASWKFVENVRLEEIQTLETKAESGNHRTNISYMDRYTCNRAFKDDYKGVSSYSSTPNRKYLDFYENDAGNNEGVRNSIMVTGSRNELFYTFMGTRYIVSDMDPGFMYEKLQSGDTLSLYENKHAYPIVYKNKNIISEEYFDTKEFPYNIELLMNGTIINGDYSKEHKSEIVKFDVEQKYNFELEEERSYTLELDEVFRNKLLYLTFNIDNSNENKNTGVLEITINGESNLLNDVQNTYYNENTKFEYVISMEDTVTLDISISKGKYNIYGTEMYYSDVFYNDYQEAEDLIFNEDNDTITCNVDGREGEYLVTSIPFDKGFSAEINGERAEVELINKAFVGLKLKEGRNDVVIKYRSPMLIPGLFVSILGVFAFIFLLLKDKIIALLKKYREIVMYLVFGVLTTLVSIVSYYIFTNTFLNTENAIQLQTANVLSWILSVTFAYVTNKFFVFKSQGNIVKEAVKFYSSRIGTLVFEMVAMYLLVTVLKLSDLLSKVFVQFAVIVLNYVLSKLIIFREKNK